DGSKVGCGRERLLCADGDEGGGPGGRGNAAVWQKIKRATGLRNCMVHPGRSAGSFHVVSCTVRPGFKASPAALRGGSGSRYSVTFAWGVAFAERWRAHRPGPGFSCAA